MSDSITRGGMPFNLDDLIHRRAIEGNRVEFKATWDERIEPALVTTVCAFANDLLNLNGGYIVLGIEEEAGRPLLPPRGLDDVDLDEVQKAIYGACKRIAPPYQPILFPADFQGRAILVVWAPGGDTRPYRAPESRVAKGSKPQYEYFVRHGPMSVTAEGRALSQLMESAAKTPFDDRRSLGARIEDLSPTLVRRFLHQVGSELTNLDPPVGDYELYDKLRIVTQVDSHKVPRNVGLLFFHEDPEKFFSGARIEVVRFDDDAGGDLIEERSFRGPLPEQIRSALEHLRNQGGELVRKVEGQAESLRAFDYPFEAIEESLVNAIYHRGYDAESEPTKVYIYPDRMEITNYPGPVAGVSLEQMQPGQQGPNAPARNRRIGEFLKELRLAEARGTGIPKIRRSLKRNGSPEPQFDFDESHTYFRTTLYINSRFIEAEIHARITDLFDLRDWAGARSYIGSLSDSPIKKLIATRVLESLRTINIDLIDSLDAREMGSAAKELFRRETTRISNQCETLLNSLVGPE